MAITEEQHPCWMLTCDRCGEHPDEQEGMTPHYATEREARAMVWDLDMREAAGWVVCMSCIDGGDVETVACAECEADIGDYCQEDTSIGSQGGACAARIDAWIVAEKAESDRRTAEAAALPFPGDDDA